MKIGAREIALLAVGFVIGAVVAALLTTTVLRLVHTAPTQSTSQADTTTQRCFNTLLAGAAADDYDQFVSVVDDTFRRSITPTTFHSISQSLAPRVQGG